MPAVDLGNGYIQAWGRKKKDEKRITLEFDGEGADFEAPPTLIITPEWPTGGVGVAETVNTISDRSADLWSDNAASTYFVHWLAIGPGSVKKEEEPPSE